MAAANDLLTTLRRIGVVPLVVIDDPAHAVPLARALRDGGLPCAEIAFRTPAALAAIERIVAEVPEVIVGAGTVRSEEQLNAAQKAGAKFIVAPGLNERIVKGAQDRNLPVLPGICTPTEADTAYNLGLRAVKFFPAEPIGGLPLLKAIAAPFFEMEFLPTGGLDASHLGAYLAFNKVMACGGSWMAPSAWIAAGHFDQIRATSADAAAIAQRRPT